jgi:MATE family multidrug resistance protein
MANTEPLLFTTSQNSSHSHLHVGAFDPAPATIPTRDADDDVVASMVVSVRDDETGALVAAGRGDDDDDDPRDAPAVRSARDALAVFGEESRRLWAIGAPIAFNILCLYGTNSTTQIFAGHIGNRELSAVAIGLSVVSNFSFGFLVSFHLLPRINHQGIHS